MTAALGDADREQILEHGLDPAEARRQLALFRDPPPKTRLARACAVGDGIVRLPADRHDALVARYETAAAAGRCSKFVPASGAASRMFRQLVAARAGKPEGRVALERLRADLDRFAFRDRLAAELERRGRRLDEVLARGDDATLLGALLGRDGLGYARAPKALVPFHAYPGGARTALEEQLVEAAAHVRDHDGVCRVHFTVTDAHRRRFEDALETLRPRLETRLGVRFEVGFSHQDPATDTIAADLEGRPFRRRNGRLLFRPGGHGALLENLEATGGDLVFVKNIDNVVPDDRRGAVVRWKKLLGGHLLELEARIEAILARCRADEAPGPWLDEALDFVAGALAVPAARGLRHAAPEDRRRFLLDRLDRPLRVCGVVPNAGEPGGGPFWVRDPDGGETLQIVETSQIAREDPEQQAILDRASHFNPVDLLCRLRDAGGRRYPLAEFVDPRTVFISRKSQNGRPLQALERPGLWNGAMARWNTVFVEVPGETFAPVKTFEDLLRPEHQP